VGKTHIRVQPPPQFAYLIRNTEQLVSALRDIPCDHLDAKTIRDAIDTIYALQDFAKKSGLIARKAQKRAGMLEARYTSGRWYPRRISRKHSNL
jgi:hypothetical protein